MRMWAVLVACVALGCLVGCPRKPPPVPEPAAFTIAIEYGVPGLASAYAAAGVRYMKPMPVYGVWGNIEPERGRYDWKALDAIILEYQAQGIVTTNLLFSAESPWASIAPSSNTFPKEEFLDDYAAFITAAVERYDGDGIDDAPGLVYPIHTYGIEREYTGFWPGNAEDYVRLLRLAYPRIHAADSQAQVLLVALLMGDVFDGNPSAEEIQARLDEPEILSHNYAEIKTILAACDAYDIVDFHSLSDYKEIPPTAAWIRSELAANGCEKPIWIGDAFSMSALIGYGDALGLVPPRPFMPATLDTRDAVIALLRSAANPDAADHDEATAWLRAEMARGLVKKCVVAAGEGILGINIGNLEDWALPNAPSVNEGLIRSFGASTFMGMMDTTLTNRYAGGALPSTGAATSRIRNAGTLRAPFYALELVMDTISTLTSVERLDLGANVWAYRFTTPSGPVWVAWHDDGALYLPGHEPPSVAVDLTIDAERVLITPTPTAAEPATSSESAGGTVHLTIDAIPIFVQPKGD